MSAEYEMRVSDAEREAAASELREHFASGRLTQDELDERLSAAFGAKTRGDLNALFADLPSSGPGWGGPFGSSGPGSWQEWRYGGYGPGPGADQSRNANRRAGAGVAMLVGLIPVLAILGALAVFGFGGIGGGRPIGIVLILAAFALLRRLLLVIFGRRRVRGGRRGSRRRRRY